MRVKAIGFLFFALFVSIASAQTPTEQSQDRLLYFTHAETIQDLQEIATVIRSMTDIRQLSVDAAQRTLALRGTAGQCTLAEWLFNELDKPANRQPAAQRLQNLAVREYRVPGGDDDVVRVFYLPRAQTVQELQETATVIRSIADIRRLFTCSAQRAVTVRGTAGQMALAEWMVRELQLPPQPGQSQAAHEYRMPGSGDDVTRVFNLTHVKTTRELQEIATNIRSVTDITRLFSYTATMAVTARGTAAQIALAGWLVNELDQRANQQTPVRESRNSAVYEYPAPGGDCPTVRVFFLAQADTPQRLQEIAVLVRSTTGLRRLFTYNALSAVVARGTPDQIAWAERLIRERDEPAAP